MKRRPGSGSPPPWPASSRTSRVGPSTRPLMTRRIRLRLRSLFRRQRLERELDKELLFHLEMLTAQQVARGMSPAEARRAALRTFGEVDRVKDDVRDTWLSRLVETLVQDVRFGLRNLRRHLGFSAIVI